VGIFAFQSTSDRDAKQCRIDPLIDGGFGILFAFNRRGAKSKQRQSALRLDKTGIFSEG